MKEYITVSPPRKNYRKRTVTTHRQRQGASTQSTGLFKRASEGTIVLSKRVLTGKGRERLYIHRKLEALTEIIVSLPRKKYTKEQEMTGQNFNRSDLLWSPSPDSRVQFQF